jgi:hypothetical protein
MTNLHAVETACVDLTAEDTKVTFAAVAERTGLSRTTLYNNPDLRAVIDEHRNQPSDPRTLTSLTNEIGHLRTAVEAIADRLRQHEERLRHLENQQPRQQAN